jgi:Flp pilus assembly protein TadB
MRISGSMFLIALGAILTFAIHVQTTGFSIHTIGIILMVVGGAALVLSLVLWSQRQRTVVRRSGPYGEVIEETRRPVDYDDSPHL